ncbi:MAG: hypothetical protein KAW12_10075 [Candidatus Aminicenantes bacterium]|nr:hypothetical protein [Candidatus Aminicenantes bacterium]
MSHSDYIQALFTVIDEFDAALYWLKRSYNICRAAGIKEKYKEDEFDAFETLTGRFIRLSDMLIQKVFRSIDKVEFVKEGTMLDALNRAHKRGLIESIEQIQEIRKLRNDISHEYAPVELKELFDDTLRYTESLFEIVDRVKAYAGNFQAGEDTATNEGNN